MKKQVWKAAALAMLLVGGMGGAASASCTSDCDAQYDQCLARGGAIINCYVKYEECIFDCLDE